MNFERIALQKRPRGRTSSTNTALLSGGWRSSSLKSHSLRTQRTRETLASRVSAYSIFSIYQGDVADIEDVMSDLSLAVAKISRLQASVLEAMGAPVAQEHRATLDREINTAWQLSLDIKQQILRLEDQPATEYEERVKRNIGNRLRKNFVTLLDNYQSIEQDYFTKCKQRVSGESQLIKLNATSEEVDIAVNDINNFRGTIYAEAMPSPTGLGELRLASREAQERHTEIARIVKTISELAHLILEMSALEEVHIGVNVAPTPAAAPAARGVTQKEADTDIEARPVQEADTRGATELQRRRNACRLWWACILVSLMIAAVVVPVTITQVRRSRRMSFHETVAIRRNLAECFVM